MFSFVFQFDKTILITTFNKTYYLTIIFHFDQKVTRFMEVWEKINYSKDAREILELLQYVPKPTLEHIKTAFRRFKKEHESTLKEI